MNTTIVIAPDQRTAVSVMRFYALRETRSGLEQAWDQTFPGYEATAANGASVALLGLDEPRIVIVDYLLWRLPPGRLTHLWMMIQVAKAKGATVVWR